GRRHRARVPTRRPTSRAGLRTGRRAAWPCPNLAVQAAESTARPAAWSVDTGAEASPAELLRQQTPRPLPARRFAQVPPTARRPGESQATPRGRRAGRVTAGHGSTWLATGFADPFACTAGAIPGSHPNVA